MTPGWKKRQIVQQIFEAQLLKDLQESGILIETSDWMYFRAKHGLQPGEYNEARIETAHMEAREDAIRRFVSPLLKLAESAWLYPSISRVELEKKNWSFLTRRGRIYELDLSQDCIAGNESFWHTSRWERGTVAVICNADFDLKPLLAGCMPPGTYSSKYQLLKGTSGAALKFAQKMRQEGKRCFLFSASNGVQYCTLLSPPDQEITDLKEAFIGVKGKVDLLEEFNIDVEAFYSDLKLLNSGGTDGESGTKTDYRFSN